MFIPVSGRRCVKSQFFSLHIPKKGVLKGVLESWDVKEFLLLGRRRIKRKDSITLVVQSFIHALHVTPRCPAKRLVYEFRSHFRGANQRAGLESAQLSSSDEGSRACNTQVAYEFKELIKKMQILIISGFHSNLQVIVCLIAGLFSWHPLCMSLGVSSQPTALIQTKHYTTVGHLHLKRMPFSFCFLSLCLCQPFALLC